MLQMHSKALVILPYLSVVAEKTEHLTGILRAMRCKVKGYMGNDESGTALSARYALLGEPQLGLQFDKPVPFALEAVTGPVCYTSLMTP